MPGKIDGPAKSRHPGESGVQNEYNYLKNLNYPFSGMTKMVLSDLFLVKQI
jgi:hypothetical protein